MVSNERKKYEILNRTLGLYERELKNSDVAQQYINEFDGAHRIISSELRLGFVPESYPSQWLYNQLNKEFTLDELIHAGVVKLLPLQDDTIKEKPVDVYSYGIITGFLKDGDWKDIGHVSLHTREGAEEMVTEPAKVIPLNISNGAHYETVHLTQDELSLTAALILGYPNTIGCNKTVGFTKEHIDMLAEVREKSKGRHVKKVRIIPNHDKDGINFAIKAGRMLREADFYVEVVILPEDLSLQSFFDEYKEEARATFDKIYMERTMSYEGYASFTLINKQNNSLAERLLQYRKVKNFIAKNNPIDEVELKIIAKELSAYASIPFEEVWKAWKPTNNMNTEGFYKHKSVVLTNNIRTFYRAEIVFTKRMAYVEDVTMAFLDKNQDITIGSILADKDSYSKEELQTIQKFCNAFHLKFYIMANMENACTMTKEEMNANFVNVNEVD